MNRVKLASMWTFQIEKIAFGTCRRDLYVFSIAEYEDRDGDGSLRLLELLFTRVDIDRRFTIDAIPLRSICDAAEPSRVACTLTPFSHPSTSTAFAFGPHSVLANRPEVGTLLG